MRTGVSALQANGHDRVQSVTITTGSRRLDIPCDLLVVHDGVVPSIDLAHGAGLELEWEAGDASWRPKTSSDGLSVTAPGPALTTGPNRIRISGDARRIGGAEAAIAHGRFAARAILKELGKSSRNGDTRSRDDAASALARAIAARPFIDSAFPPGLAHELPSDDAIVCRCEEITAGTLRTRIRDGATDMNLVRGVIRCGMGPCQGRNCAVTLARLLAEAKPDAALAPVPFRARPPLRPLPLGALARLTGLDPELAEVVSLEDKPDAGLEGDTHV